MSVIGKAKRGAALATGAATLYGIAIKVEGKPVREKDKPAAVKLFGVIPIFERDEELNRYWFGFIARGKAKP